VRVQCCAYVIFVSLTATFVCPQVAPSTANGAHSANAENSATSASPPATNVGPDDPVITVNGFCPESAQPSDACKTIITRAQFEKLTEALQPGMPLSLRLKVAYNYARMMRMTVEAEKRSLDKTPAFAEEMRYARMQLLSQDLSRNLQEEANNVSDAELKDYYTRNESSFEQATLARIFVPHSGGSAAHTSGTNTSPAQSDADAAAMAKLAIELRTRTVSGEDPDRLQIEAYAAAGIPQTDPKTRMEKVRRVSLPPSHEMVMNLKPGEVSEVVSDPEGAHFIYKMISKETLSLEEVKNEIREQIASQRFKDSMKRFEGDTVFSDAYFAPPGQHAADPHRHRTGKKPEAPAARP
jgi:hypothetical protein